MYDLLPLFIICSFYSLQVLFIDDDANDDDGHDNDDDDGRDDDDHDDDNDDDDGRDDDDHDDDDDGDADGHAAYDEASLLAADNRLWRLSSAAPSVCLHLTTKSPFHELPQVLSAFL